MSKYKNRMSINKALYDKDKDWPFLRKKIMNKWICKPDWCCLQLRRFLGRLLYSDLTKLKIVSTYLSSSGFRPGAINYQCVVNLKQDVFNEVKNRKNKGKWY